MIPLVQLRPVNPDDDPFLRELEAQPGVHDRIGGLNSRKLKTGYFRIATLNALPVGVVALVPSPATGEGDLQLVCVTTHQLQCRGVASAASRGLLREYGSTSPPHRVVARVAPDNAAGARVASKLGFRRLSTLSEKGEIVFELGPDVYASLTALSNER